MSVAQITPGNDLSVKRALGCAALIGVRTEKIFYKKNC